MPEKKPAYTAKFEWPDASAMALYFGAMKVMLVQAGGPPGGLLGCLSRYGLRVVVGDSAAAALELVERVPLRAVVADYHLPDRSGVWLLRQVRDRLPGVQRILTVDEPRIDIDRLVSHGICHAGLRRPYDPTTMLDVLAGVPQREEFDETPVVGIAT